MDRPVKFRAWDKNLKEFVDFSQDMNSIVYHLGSMIVICEGCSRNNGKECFIVTQHTGLTDCNGVEIFEGDIIKGRNIDGEFPVHWHNSYWCINNAPLHKFYYSSKLDLEVVGNIFEEED